LVFFGQGKGEKEMGEGKQEKGNRKKTLITLTPFFSFENYLSIKKY